MSRFMIGEDFIHRESKEAHRVLLENMPVVLQEIASME
jgi:hypothetical protein